MSTPEGLITVAEAAHRLGRSIEQVRRYLREGKLQGQRIGQQWFIDAASLEVRYQPSGGRPQRIREPVAVMETRKLSREEIEAVIKRIDENREAIRRESGAFAMAELVDLIREVREGH